MVPIVVRENQTVRGVKMSEPLMNILKIIVVSFICIFVWNTAVGDIKGWDSKYSQKENKEEVETEEEPDCE